MDPNLRKFVFLLIILVLSVPLMLETRCALLALFPNASQHQSWVEISFSQLLTDVEAGRVQVIAIGASEIRGTYSDGRNFGTDVPSDPTLMQHLYKLLHDKGVTIKPTPS